ncbi:hypothetical protein CHS0354_011126 [Potamilus streckersoni]|uniref:Uncharacterized protein n=1 Tax=Potamilus streckersoni TaxID=2493646 RepID=A0AAE0SAH7_9BIVA|nr:hypothetical protein CHS0354_011126 [Potamilus streckersoni]
MKENDRKGVKTKYKVASSGIVVVTLGRPICGSSKEKVANIDSVSPYTTSTQSAMHRYESANTIIALR